MQKEILDWLKKSCEEEQDILDGGKTTGALFEMAKRRVW